MARLHVKRTEGSSVHFNKGKHMIIANRWACPSLLLAVVVALASSTTSGQVVNVAGRSTLGAQVEDNNETLLKEQLRAVEEGEAIKADAHRRDKSGLGYDVAFVKRLENYYRYGGGTAEVPASPIVVRTLAREVVLALVRQLFSNDPSRGFTKDLDGNSELQLRRFVAQVLIPGALADLNSLQRIRLYVTVEEICLKDKNPNNDPDLIGALEQLLAKATISSGDGIGILSTLERIVTNGNPPSKDPVKK